jgi:MerR family transcriptional regulator, light-induced transcriptional regulator
MQKTILSTADVARLFKVTETTVKRWADDGMLRCQKTPGGHRRFPIRSIVEFAEKNNLEPVGALDLSDHDGLAFRIQAAVLERDFSELTRVFVEKALSPDRCDLFQYLSYLYEHRFQVWEIYDEIIRPGMSEIGMRWARGEIGINHEHRASYETLDAMAKLQAQIMVKPPNGKSAMLACVGDEPHEIGLRCISYLLESEGWVTHYLGARMPVSAIASAVHDLKPSLICLSLTQLPKQWDWVDELRQLSRTLCGRECNIILGGRASDDTGLQRSPFDAVCSTSRELLEFLQAQFDRRSPPDQQV